MKPYAEGRGWVLYHGDCREVLPHVGKVDAVVTDPPFGIGFAAQPTKWQRAAGKQPESWDDCPSDVGGLLSLAPIIVIWGGNYFALPPSRGWLSWFKPDAPPSMASLELAWTNQNRNARQIWHSISATNGERLGHATQKPVRVMRWCMDEAGVACGSLVADPFAGVASIGEACIVTGRRYIGIEIDERWCEVAAKRLRRAEEDTAMFAQVEHPKVQEQDLFEGEE